MGGSGSVTVKYGADRAGAPRELSSGQRLGELYGCRDPGGQCAGPAGRLFPVGEAGADEGGDAEQSEASGLKDVPSESAVRTPRIFRMQAFQQSE